MVNNNPFDYAQYALFGGPPTEAQRGGGEVRNRRTTDRQRHELEPPLYGISGPSDPVSSARFSPLVAQISGYLTLVLKILGQAKQSTRHWYALR